MALQKYELLLLSVMDALHCGFIDNDYDATCEGGIMDDVHKEV